MRIAGVTISDSKQLLYALPYIYGIGPTRAKDILTKAGIAFNKKGSELSSEEEKTIRELAEGYLIEGELRRDVAQNVKRHKDIGTKRGSRHARRLPVKNQRTKTNSRTVRGNTRKTMGSGRRTLEKT